MTQRHSWSLRYDNMTLYLQQKAQRYLNWYKTRPSCVCVEINRPCHGLHTHTSMSEPSKYSADELECIALMERMMKEQEKAAVARGEAYDPSGPTFSVCFAGYSDEEDEEYVGDPLGMDPGSFRVAYGVFVAPSLYLKGLDTWAELDTEVVKQLGDSPGIGERYAACFPEHGVEFDEKHKKYVSPGGFLSSGYFVTDGHGSCCVTIYEGGNAYVYKLCAYPQGELRGTAFMTKVKAFLGSMDTKRVFLFTDKGCNERLDKFYTLQCGFSALERGSSVYIPYQIEEIWGEDTLYLADLVPG